MTMDGRARWLALIVVCLGDLMIVLDVDDRGRRAALDPRGPRLLGDLARVGRERLPADVRRVPPARRQARRPLRAPTAVLSPASCSSRSRRSPAASRPRRAADRRARVQGLGGAVVSAVALSLIVTLFVEPAERAKAMGVFGFVASGGGGIGVLLGGIITDALNWHWIFLVNVPIGSPSSRSRSRAALGAHPRPPRSASTSPVP